MQLCIANNLHHMYRVYFLYYALLLYSCTRVRIHFAICFIRIFNSLLNFVNCSLKGTTYISTSLKHFKRFILLRCCFRLIAVLQKLCSRKILRQTGLSMRSLEPFLASNNSKALAVNSKDLTIRVSILFFIFTFARFRL